MEEPTVGRKEKLEKVRADLSAASVKRTKSKRFMTPERKKKLRVLLRKNAAKIHKEKTDAAMAERRKVIEQRVGQPKKLEGLSDGELRALCKEYHKRICMIEDKKWDLEQEVEKKNYSITDLDFQVNDCKGKFVKPTLKKVAKQENKFAKLQSQAAKYQFRNQLKTVKKQEYTLKEPEEDDHDKKPDWALQKDGRSKSMASVNDVPRSSESETPQYSKRAKSKSSSSSSSSSSDSD